MATCVFYCEACSQKGAWLMNVGIVTFFCVPNYGAMLQAYALWKFLEERGHNVEFIDYAFGNARRIPLWKCFAARNLIGYFGAVRKKLKAYVRFNIVHFSDVYPRTRRVATFSELEDVGGRFDALIVGSDQMWNPLWCSGKSLPVVMLDFAARGKKRIAYAASFGTNEWKKEQNADGAGRLLREFDAISVREESGMRLVQELSGRDDAKWVLDPTLLHSASFYEPLLNNERYKQHRYVFSYMLDEWLGDENIGSALREVMASKGIDEIHTDKVSVSGLLSPICRLLEVQSKVLVGTWLSEISNSDFVVTNSFHGTVFSILFHRPFLTIPVSGNMSGMNERVTSLLSLVGLRSRIISTKNLEECREVLDSVIDWDDVDRRLDAERARSEAFLKGALQ